VSGVELLHFGKVLCPDCLLEDDRLSSATVVIERGEWVEEAVGDGSCSAWVWTPKLHLHSGADW